MSRHSKNNTNSSVFTNAERKKLKYGTVTERLGGDSIKALDACSLCLNPVIEPMCCRKGHLFCKECIFEYLLAQRKEIARQTARFEEQEKKLKEEEEYKEAERKKKEIKEFDEVAHGLLPTSRPQIHRPESEGKRLVLGNSSDTGALVIYNNEEKKTQNTTVTPDDNEDNKKMKLASFWVPGVTPDAPAELIKKPDADTHCPEGKHVLRLKQLIPVKLTPNNNKDGSKYQCGVCYKALTNSMKLAVIKPCGHAVCVQCLEKTKSDGACPICSVKFAQRDVIKLESGGTGFAGSLGEKLNAKKFTPTAWL